MRDGTESEMLQILPQHVFNTTCLLIILKGWKTVSHWTFILQMYEYTLWDLF